MHKNWKEAEATVASVELHQGSRGGVWYEVVFTFKVDGGYYGGTYTTSDETSAGDIITVHYDPANPDHNDLEAREKWKRWALGAALLLVALLFLYSAMR